MSRADCLYHCLLRDILDHGRDKADRTGVGTRSIFGAQLRFDLCDGFPLLTTKRVWWKGVVEELLWMLSGSTDAKALQARGVHIWDEWATKEQCARFGRDEGDLGPVYGHQWRNFGSAYSKVTHESIDQIARVIHDLRTNPDSRRHIVTGWNPKEADQVALPPCHTLFQFYVCDGELSCQLYQRSADVFLGVPFNIASYALLTHIVAHCCGLKPATFIHTFGDVHIYKNHFAQVELQLGRKPYPAPRLRLRDGTPKEIDAITSADVGLEDYQSHPAIKADVAV